MILSLITREQYISLRLPERKDGFFVLRDTDGKELFTVEGDGEWTVRESDFGRLPKGQPVELKSGMLTGVHIRQDMQGAYLFAEDAGARYAKYARAQTPDTVEYTVGSQRDNSFVCLNPYISAHHCKLLCRNRAWSVTDLGSKAGTFVNGRRIGAGLRPLSPGDVVSVLNQKFIVLPGLLAFNAQNLDVQALKGVVSPFKAPPLPLDHPYAPAGRTVYFHRRPRFTDSIEGKDLSVAPPPVSRDDASGTTAMLSYGPAVASGAAMLLSGMNPVSGLLMMASSILFPKLSRDRSAREKKEQEARNRQLFLEMLESKEKELSELFKAQTASLRKQTPDPREEAERLLSDKSMLWSHRAEHRDFLNLRLGLGDVPALVNISFPPESREAIDDPLQKKLQEFQNKPRLLQDVPIVLELRKYYSVGISGDSAVRTSFAVQLLGQLTMHVGYDDLKLCLIGPLPGPLASLRWLPHTWDDDRVLHLMAGDRKELDQLLPELDRIIQGYRNGQLSQEFIILITDPEYAQSGVLTRLLFDTVCEHIHIFTLAKHSAQLPSRSDVVIGVREERGRMVWQEKDQRQTADFRPDKGIDAVMARLAYLMANTFLDIRTEKAEMPSTVPFLEMFGVSDVRRLNILDRWDRADPARSLGTPIGVSEGGVPCVLDVSEKGDGSHGLVAGTTGSGKSELLMSYILSMAVNYSPRDVAFALIDYKGGGTANAFAELPHTVGVITNLSDSIIQRSEASIDSEYKRRQRIFAETQKKFGLSKMEISDYQQLYKAGKVSEPMPHLLIITDEFAELKSQEPDFMKKLLVPAARIGRSLGIHLLLATQQPAGIVDDQILTNTNFRICLRMASAQDSQSILKTPAAAELERAGSFYKQVGSALTLAQSAYAGAEYDPDKPHVPNCGVEVLGRNGAVLQRQLLPVSQRANAVTQATAVTRHIIQVAKREGIHNTPLWLPELEERISLSGLRERYHAGGDPWVLKPILGELDDPANQRRALVRAELSAGKNTIVYGGTGSGKVMLLSAVLEDLLLCHSPEQLHIYIIDFFDDGLYTYAAAPQVGDVLTIDDDEKLFRLLGMLEKEIGIRRKTLGGALSSAPLSERLRKAGMCHILVVLHNLGSLRDRLGDKQLRLQTLLKDGPRWGISFLATQESASGLNFSTAERFPQRYMLQMDQETDYAALLGKTGKMHPAPIRGRGLLRTDDGFYEFQSATADEEPGALCQRLRDSWQGPAAAPIRVMPEHVTPDELAPGLDPARPLRLPVGLGTEDVEPVYFDLAERRVHAVMGRRSAVTRFLRGLLPLVAKNGLQVTAFDLNGALEGLPGVGVVPAGALPDTLDRMLDECIRLKNAYAQGQPLPGERALLVLPDVRGVMNALQEADRQRLAPLLRLQESHTPLTAAQKQELDDPEKLQYQLRHILELMRPYWGWTFLVCGTPQDFKALLENAKHRAWLEASSSMEDGLFLDSDIRSQLVMKYDAKTVTKLSGPFPKGYVVRETELEPVQFVEQ